VRILRSTVGFATSANDLVNQVNIYEGTASTYHDATAPDVAVFYSVFARDTAGNWSSRATVGLPIVVVSDTTAPITTSVVNGTAGASGWHLSVPTVSLTANEAATTSYQWDGTAGTWSTYASALSAPQGTHTLHFRSTDTAGNAETAKSVTLKVDSGLPSAPTAASSSHPDADAPSTAGVAEFTFGATDSVSGVSGYSYTFNQSAATTPDTGSEGSRTSASFPVAADGSWYLHVRALDGAGNWGPATHSKITADRTGPTAPVLAATAGAAAVTLAWTPASDSLTTRILRSTSGYPSSAADASATLVYEGIGTTYSDASVAVGTKYYYAAFSRDAAGNWSAGSQATATAGKQTPVMSLKAVATTIAWNKYATLEGQYLLGGTKSKSTLPVTVWSNASGTWKQVGTASYNSTLKTYGFRMRMTKSASLEMRSGADTLRTAATSNRVAITVKRTVSLSTTTASVTLGSAARTTVLVAAPAPTQTKVVRAWYNPKSHRWTLRKVIKVKAKTPVSGYARLSTAVKLPKKGKWRLYGIHTVNGVTTRSKAVYVRVR